MKGVAEESKARVLPIELSSIVVTLETLTRELTKKLTVEEAREVVSELCARLLAIADEKRSPDRPFTPPR